MAELADATVLGAVGRPCRFESCYPHWIIILRTHFHSGMGSEYSLTGEGIFFSSRSLDRFYIYSSNKIFAHEAYDKNMSADIRTMKDSESKEEIENKKCRNKNF